MKIRKGTITDVEGRGYVHYHAWNETYTGLIDQAFLDRRTVDACADMARRFPHHTFVAEDEGKIVGFACYKNADAKGANGCHEIKAIYVLKAYQKRGVGKDLLKACMAMFNDTRDIILWVLDKNQPAIDFYEKQGFKKDGDIKDVKISNACVLHEIRMCYTRK